MLKPVWRKLLASTAQLAQARPANTTEVSIYSPSKVDRYIVTHIVICNTTSSSATFRLFHDEDGTTYDETTALLWDISLAGNTSMTFGCDIYLNSPSANLAVKSGTGNALTYTVYGDDGST